MMALEKPKETNIQNLAQYYCGEAVIMRRTIANNFVQYGLILDKIQSLELYKHWGCPTLLDFLHLPEIDTPYSTAIQLIGVSRHYCKRLEIEPDVLMSYGLGYRRLYILKSYINKRNYQNILPEMKKFNRRQFQKRVNEIKHNVHNVTEITPKNRNKETPICPYAEMYKCPYKKMKGGLYEKQIS